MTPSPARIAEIAAALSEAQRETTLALTDLWQAGPALVETVITELGPMRYRGLVEREFGHMRPPEVASNESEISVWLSACWWFRLTPLGILVRNHLIGEAK